MKANSSTRVMAIFGATLALAVSQQSGAGFFDDLTRSLQRNPPAAGTPQPMAPAPGPVQPQPAPQFQGTVTKNANVRSGPGTSNAKLGTIAAGSEVTILSQNRDWFQVQTDIEGRSTTGWVYAPLVSVNAIPAGMPSPTQTPGKAAGLAAMADQTNVSYAGYSEDFQPVKKMMETGDLQGVERIYSEQEEQVRKVTADEVDLMKTIGFLRWLERGSLAVDQGDFDESVESFTNAETLLDIRHQESKAVGWLKGGTKGVFGLLSGNQEVQDYRGEGYERVLMLNYKSIAYLLQGQRKAYNVTRRAIDWQNTEKKEFEKKLREVEEKLAEKGGDASQQPTSDTGINDRVSQEYAKFDAKASTVASAYVNPFGYYVAGMVQEYESYDDWSLRDNARISYEKALELNPGSKVLKTAAKEMKQRNAPAGTRLVHVVVADGFVPEKKMLTYTLALKSGVIPIKLTMYEPDPSAVHRVEVQTTGGRRLATLSPVADVEAICLRHQKDMEPFRQLKVALAVASSVAVGGVLESLGVIGNKLSEKREEMAAPDMRSWMSLPSTIQAARLHLKKGLSKLKIVSFDKRGKRLGSKLVDISRKSHDFVYVRSLGKQMYGYSTKKLWMMAAN